MSLKERVNAGDQLVTFAVGRMFNPNVIRFLGMTGDFDGFWIDVEHAGLTTRDVEHAVAAGMSFGLDSFVRIRPRTTPR